jgi:uroporphyrinogen-III synthase
LRVERVVERVEKPVWCVEYRDRVVEVIPPPPDPTQAAAIVLTSPRACRVVLDRLTDATTLGTLHRSEHAATVRAAARLLTALREAGLLT